MLLSKSSPAQDSLRPDMSAVSHVYSRSRTPSPTASSISSSPNEPSSTASSVSSASQRPSTQLQHPQQSPHGHRHFQLHTHHSHHHSHSPPREAEECAFSIEEYEELLNAEVFVEVDKLREYARHGIPKDIRGDVWLYLLRVQDADRSKEVSTQRQHQQEFEQLDKEPDESTRRVRGEISRYLRKHQKESCRDLARTIEEVVSAYCNQNHQVEYFSAMVNLCAPFVYSIRREWEAYLCFEKMVNTLDEHFNDESINESVAKFMTLFHMCLPELYSYFEEEEVDIREWAVSALQSVLSKEMTLDNTMRLWDTYFAIPDGYSSSSTSSSCSPPPLPVSQLPQPPQPTSSSLSSSSQRHPVSMSASPPPTTTVTSLLGNIHSPGHSSRSNHPHPHQGSMARSISGERIGRVQGWIEFHPFFCLAVLKHLKERFEDLEQSEIRTMLMRLPSLDMDYCINEAFNIRHELLERQILDEDL